MPEQVPDEIRDIYGNHINEIEYLETSPEGFYLTREPHELDGQHFEVFVAFAIDPKTGEAAVGQSDESKDDAIDHLKYQMARDSVEEALPSSDYEFGSDAPGNETDGR